MSDTSIGTVSAVRGAVVDVRFAEDDLPPLESALRIHAAGLGQPLLVEVQSHLDPATVRCVALGATAGVARVACT